MRGAFFLNGSGNELGVGAFAAEVVFDTLYVVFAEVITMLNFDDDNRGIGGVHHAVRSATGDINGLTDGASEGFAFENDGERASCNDPNFTSLFMALVAQALARKNGNGLNLVIFSIDENVIAAPRAVVVFE